jgi:ABC-2 type transport system ATP-binding protein
MITIAQVSKAFGASRSLDGIDLVIPDGQRIALIGSNGAGKTTLFRCLLGEYVHDGEVRVDGLDPRRERAAVLRRIGFVPQVAPRLGMPVGALVRWVAEVGGGTTEAIAAVADRMGLDIAPIARRPFIRLSGGMKQKLLVALALGRPTDILILDEPTANLDPAARASLLDLLVERRGATMIVSSHRLDEIAGLVDRVVELDRGRVVLDDTVTDAGALGSTFRVACQVARDEASFARAAGDWGLAAAGSTWTGTIAGPDRLHFLGFMARHAGLIRSFSVEEVPKAAGEPRQEADHAQRADR